MNDDDEKIPVPEPEPQPTADVIDLPVKVQTFPIPTVLLTELRQMQAARAILLQQLGRAVAEYGQKKSELMQKIQTSDAAFGSRARDALLFAGVHLGDDKEHWDVDLKEGVIRKA